MRCSVRNSYYIYMYDNHIVTYDIDHNFSEQARIQVRLPDGSSINNTFSSSDNLQAVADFVTGVSLKF